MVTTAGSWVLGHLRHILVDTLGLLLQVVVSAANVAERTGAILLLEKIKDKLPRLSKIFSDGGYDGADFIGSVQSDYQLNWEVVKRKQSKGFQVLPSAMDSGEDSGMVGALQTINY